MGPVPSSESHLEGGAVKVALRPEEWAWPCGGWGLGRFVFLVGVDVVLGNSDQMYKET